MLEGQVLGKRYEILRTIGGGGMSNVYLANDRILERNVAIKVLRLEYANDAEFVARFDREAHSATSLSHPNIVNIYDVGEEDQIFYIVMEYVDGMTLKEYIHQKGPLDVRTSLDMMKQVTKAIAHAHANGFIHRDIKPQNILIDRHQQVKVTDFGIALALSATSLTQTNSIIGSVHYLSPEQARGSAATNQSDIYALGIVLYEMLTGEIPFSGQSPVSIAIQHLQEPLPSIRDRFPEIPQSIENIVLKATAKNPANRYTSVYEMEGALDLALNPGVKDEPKFVESGQEETKKLPMLKDLDFHEDALRETIIHKTSDQQPIQMEEEKIAEGKTEPNKKKRKKWIILATTAFLILVIFIFILFIFPYVFKKQDVKIPDIVGMEYKEAVDLLNDNDLLAEKDEMYSDEMQEGHVIKTNPSIHRTVKEDSTVVVYVSLGKEKEEFANYEGRDITEVKEELSHAGYKDIVIYDKYSEQNKGEVIKQVQPAQGESVIPSETKVIFEVSQGSEYVTLDDLQGMKEQEAVTYLKENDLVANKEEAFSEEVGKGLIIEQKPAAKEQVKRGSSVTLVISKGKEAKKPVKEKVELIVPYHRDGEDGDTDDHNEQKVKIYIGDAKHDLSDIYKEKEITKDETFKITLTIAPDDKAEYKVMRDDTLLIHEVIRYEEVNE